MPVALAAEEMMSGITGIQSCVMDSHNRAVCSCMSADAAPGGLMGRAGRSRKYLNVMSDPRKAGGVLCLPTEVPKIVADLWRSRRRQEVILMDGKELILASLFPAKDSTHTPVQVQKLLFLIDTEIPSRVGGPYFRWQPYNYGPFDKTVYDRLRELRDEGFVEMVPDWNWNSYRLTSAGQALAEQIFGRIDPIGQKFIRDASGFVQKLSFSDLVSAIYKAYPDMRKNSVFQEQK